MEPLLERYSKIDPEALSVQAAILDEVTYEKAIATGMVETYTKTEATAKRFLKWAGARVDTNVVPAKSTSAKVLERQAYWKQRPASEVREHIIKTLGEKLQVSSGDLGYLSVRLIEEAAEGFGISGDLLLSQQAEAVALKYFEESIKGVREQLRKQGESEMRATDATISASLAGMSQRERLEIQKALGLQTLSASAMRTAVLTSGLPLASIVGLQASGFGAYLALTTVMNGVFTGLLGITLPFAAYTTATSALSVLTGPIGILATLGIGAFGYLRGRRNLDRSQYAMVVFSCVAHDFRKLVPESSSLPSLKGTHMLTSWHEQALITPRHREEDFRLLQQEKNANAASIAGAESGTRAAETVSGTVKKLEQRLQRAQLALQAALSANANSNYLEQACKLQIEQQQRSILQVTAELADTRRRLEELQLEVTRLNVVKEEAYRRFTARVEKRKEELRVLWSLHYKNIIVGSQALRWSAEQDFPARIEIERALQELANAPNPVKLSRSKMIATGEHHSAFTIPKNVPCRLFFIVKDGKVLVSKICKKNEC